MTVSFTWDQYQRLITCHRCHKILGDDAIPVGRNNYHPKCVPPAIFHKLVRTTPHGSSIPQLSIEDRADREIIKSGDYVVGYSFKLPVRFAPRTGSVIRLSSAAGFEYDTPVGGI